MSDQEEIWKDIEGYEGKYQVSNMGRVKSLYIRFKETGGKIIKPRISKDGYPVINLFHKGTEKHKILHRLIAQAFIPNPENKKQVNHKDGVKTNNTLENLEWVTNQENMDHAYRTGLNKSFRENHGRYLGNICGYDENGLKVVEFCGFKDMVNKGYRHQGVYDCVNGKKKTYKGLLYKRA